MDKKKIVVTGIGAVTPCGLNTVEYWNNLVAGKSGIDTIKSFDVSSYPTKIAGELKGFDAGNYVDRKIVRRLDPFIHYAFAAAREALDMGKVTKESVTAYGPERCGMIIGSGIGGMTTFYQQSVDLATGGYRKISPFFIPAMITNMAGGMIAIDYNFQGPNFSVSTACATGSHALYLAVNLLRKGDADIILAGGSEAAVSPLGLSGFISEKALSTRNDEPQRASRPFDVDRDGFVMGEGAGLILLETEESALKRGVPILAEIAGSGISCDAYHMTAPKEDGSGAGQAIYNALNDAGITPQDIDYVNTHGTSTPLGDVGETKAMKKIFGDHAYKLKINSTKSMTGHLLGASGGIEAIACIKTVQTDTIHPTINLDNPDPQCDLDYVPHKSIKHTVNYAISNSFGFGGHNACVVVKKYKA